MESLLIFIFLSALILFFFIKAFYLLTIVFAIKRTGGALFTSTHPAKVRAILDAIPMNADQVVVDLGCGDGRFISAAAKRYGVRAIGYEVNLLAYMLAKIRQAFNRGKIVVKRADFWEVASLKGADIVFCYLFPDVMGHLASKAREEMKDGAILISCNFPLPGWKPENVIRGNHPTHRDPIFVYCKKENDEGSSITPLRDTVDGSERLAP